MSSTSSHYAFLNKNNVVVNILVYENDDLPEGYESFEDYYGEAMGMTCKRTCPDTLAGNHISGGIAFRGNYAQIGFVYDEELDAFISKRPYPSWIFEEGSYSWIPPVEYPKGSEQTFEWNEKNKTWMPVVLKPGE